MMLPGLMRFGELYRERLRLRDLLDSPLQDHAIPGFLDIQSPKSYLTGRESCLCECSGKRPL